MNERRRKQPYEDGHELFMDSFQVASMSDCTGLIPSIPQTDAEIDSYSQIYDIPLPNHKNDRRKNMNDQNRNNNQNKNQNQNKKDNNQNQNKKNNDSNDMRKSYND